MRFPAMMRLWPLLAVIAVEAVRRDKGAWSWLGLGFRG